jgi:lysophospholipid acyltransferase (LPLAT)-like uncharacterized protein
MLPAHPPRPLLSAAVALGVRALGGLVRLRRGPGAATLPGPGPAVLVGWHGEQLGLLWGWRHTGMRVVVSRSRDGDLATAALARLGVGAIRGSSSRGGAAALREAVRHLRAGGRVAVLVDGPRGPRHQVAPGAAAMAALGGAPLVCTRAIAPAALRLRSWDRFEIPAPLSRVELRAAALPEPARDEVEAATARIGALLQALGEAPQVPAQR